MSHQGENLGPGVGLNSLPQPLLDTFLNRKNQHQLRDHAAHSEQTENGEFVYKVDVSGFDDKEIQVKVEGRQIVISAEHKVNTEHESVERSFSRRFNIPENAQNNNISCRVNENGLLTITNGKNNDQQQHPISNNGNIPIEFH